MSNSKKFLNYVRGFDRFGHEVKVSYQGSEYYKTMLGSIVTFAVYTLVLINLITSSLDFINNEN